MKQRLGPFNTAHDLLKAEDILINQLKKTDYTTKFERWNLPGSQKETLSYFVYINVELDNKIKEELENI